MAFVAQVSATEIPPDVASSPEATAQLNWDDVKQTHTIVIGDGDPMDVMPKVDVTG